MYINWFEFFVVFFGVKCFVYLYNCFVKVFCDNSIVVVYINNLGGMVFSFYVVFKVIWEWCFVYYCMLEVFYILGSLNLQVDLFFWQYN